MRLKILSLLSLVLAWNLLWMQYTKALSSQSNNNLPIDPSTLTITSFSNQPQQFVVFVADVQAYYLATKSTDKVIEHTRYRILPDKEIAIEFGWEDEFGMILSHLPIRQIESPLPLFQYNVSSNSMTEKHKRYQYLSHAIDYFNLMFQGDPKIVEQSMKLPRYERRTQNAAIIPIANKYLIALGTYVALVSSIETLPDFHANLHRISISHPKSWHELTSWHEQDHRFYKLNNDNVILTGTVSLVERGNKFAIGAGDFKIGLRYLTKEKESYLAGHLIVLFNKDSIGNMNTTFETCEKNWGSFMYQKELHFVYKISPLVIIKLIGEPHQVTYRHLSPFLGQYVKQVSSHNCFGNDEHGIAKHWIFREYRGGTPALLVRGKYLAFLHTRANTKMLYQAGIYIMGAYEFQVNHQGVFELTRISPRPFTSDIVKPYDNIPRAVVFPMSFYLIDEYGQEIPEGVEEVNPNKTRLVLIAGLNDMDTARFLIHLNTLLESMQSVHCIDSMKTTVNS